MNTLVIVGMLAIGLGLLGIVAAVALIFLRPSDSPKRGSSPARPESSPARAPGVAPAAASEPEASDAPRYDPQGANLPTPEEDDPFGHINTGVLNVKDFEDFEELLAAADALTKGKSEGE